MEQITYDENKSLDEALKDLFKDYFHTEKYEKVKGKISLFCDDETKKSFDMYLPVYDTPDKDYIPYSIIYVYKNEIFMESDYEETAGLIGSARAEKLSDAMNELSNEELSFLTKEFEMDADYLFYEMNGAALESKYYALYDVLEDAKDCRRITKRLKMSEEIMLIFNKHLSEFYCGGYNY